VALGKMLNMGGIDNRPPKANQSLGRFRIARNVMPTPENTLIPRYDWTTPNGQPSTARCIHHITSYDNDPLAVYSSDLSGSGAGAEEYCIYRNTTKVPSWSYLGGSPVAGFLGDDYYQSVQSHRVNNTTYFLLPYSGNLIKYDGVEVGYAGSPQPNFSVANASLTGSRYLRAIRHVIDFDNNEPVSEYVQFTTNGAAVAGNATTNIHLSDGTPALYSEIPGGIVGVVPNARTTNTLSVENYFIGTATYSSGELTVTSTDTNIVFQNQIGSYVFIAGSYTEAFTVLGAAFAASTYFGVALKIKSTVTVLGTTTIVLDTTNAYLMDANRQWGITDISAAGANLAVSVTYGCRSYITFWESLTSTGIYYYRAIKPYFPDSISTGATTPIRTTITTTYTATATTGSEYLMFTVSPILNDWYDLNTRKLSPNMAFPYGDVPFFSMTKFQGMLLFANDQYIWSSDTTLGGWIEQLNSGSSYLIGDKEYGRITSICGTQDFLFVGRERKNYYVTGNLSTGNYRVQEITEMETGPWCNNSTINVKDSVIAINTLGVFQIMAGGKAVNLAKNCPKNFENYNANSVNEDVNFRMTGFVSKVFGESYSSRAADFGLAVAYDEFRELLVWMKRAEGNDCLVLHTKTGEFYEWSDMLWGYTNMFANCISFIQAEYILGGVDVEIAPYSTRAKRHVEDNSVLKSYSSISPVMLYTTWLTAGEPSLEKELLQLKMFGRVFALSTNPLKIRHYKDWNKNTLITDTTYIPTVAAVLNSQTQFSHKKRLNSDKCLAASVGIEMSGSDIDFELESIEVEFNPIQSGMKR